MVEATILKYLSDTLNKTVVTERRASVTAPYVLIQKTGSSRQDMVDTAVLAIQSYGNTMLEAAQLNEAVKAAMFDAYTQEGISSVKLNSDYNYTDTTTKQYRYQAVFEVVHFC